MARFTITLLSLVVIVSLSLRAQQQAPSDPQPRYGVYSDLNWNLHTASFRSLPQVPNCCPEFQSGSGAGGTFGVLYETPLSPDWWFALRGSYSSQGATLTAIEHTTVILDLGTQDGEIEHSIAAGISTIGLEPMIGYRPFGGLTLYLGGRLGYVLSSTFSQQETLKQPEDRGRFLNGRRTRNDTSGTIPNASALNGAVLFGLSNELRLNAAGTLWAVPEIFFALGVTPVMKDSLWHTSALRFGVSLKYSPRAMAPAPALDRTAGSSGSASAAEAPASLLSASIAAYGVDTLGREVPSSTLRVEEFVSTHMRPLLNYIFFDEGSSTLPDRYIHLDPPQAAAFGVDKLHDVDVLPTYYQMLNVVGRRLADNPSATIRLVGCNADAGVEHGNDALSRRRAEAVRDYLAGVWKVDSGRMKIEARNLPEKASSETDPDGIAENRRVEILSDTWSILEPVVTKDTIRRVTPPTVRFKPAATPTAAVARWRIEVHQGDRILKVFSGDGLVPPVLEWNIDLEKESIPRAADPVGYTLTVQDRAGHASVASGTLPVEQITIRKKRQEQVADRIIDRYSLILFDFDRSDLNAANRRIAEFIKGRIGPDATTTIVGHTDRIGDADYNRRLSESRARAMATSLGLADARVSGVGESNVYDNDLPEGRFYCRTVMLVVETPVR